MARFFIHRPVFAWVIAIIIMLGGALAISTLSISQYPDISPTTVRISATYSGATAEAVENSVTTVIEDGMTGLDDLTYMTSSSSTGSASVTLTFGETIDADIAQVQVQNKLSLVESQLPDTVVDAGLRVSRSTSSILMVGALTSEDGRYSSIELGDILSSRIETQLERLEGVGSMQVFGSGYAMRIWLDPYKLSQFQLTPADVTSAISAQNKQATVGALGAQPTVEGQQLNVSITSQSMLQTVDQFEKIILKQESNGSLIRLADVAKVEIGQEDYGSYNRFNGKPAAGFAVNLATGANAIDTSSAVRDYLDSVAPSLPEGVVVEYAYDTTPFVELSIEKVVETLIEAIVLVFLVLLLFLQNIRATLIPTIAVPVVLLGAFGVLAMAGFSINTLTMFAMVLAIGLLVDDAIVVVENVERIMEEEGLGPVEATEKSMGQIIGALVGIALVLSAVFVPMAFFGGSVGVIYQQFSITIVSAMTLSAIVAIVLTPALCASILRSPKDEKPYAPARWFNRKFSDATTGYVGAVGRLLKRPFRVAIVFAVLIAGAWGLFSRLPSSFLPAEDQGVLMTIVTLPDGATTARTDAVMKEVEEYYLTQETDSVASIFTSLGFGFGGSGQNTAMAFVRLRDFDERTEESQSAQAVAGRASAAFAKIRDANVFAVQPPAMPGLGNTSGFSMYLVDQANTGTEALQEAANSLVRLGNADAQLTSIRGAEESKDTQLKLDIDQERSGAMGIELSDVNTMLATIFTGTDVNDFILDGEIKPVIVQGATEFRMQPEDIGSWFARNNDGEMVSLDAFVTTGWVQSPPQLARFNGLSAVELSGSAAADVSSGDAMDRMEALTAELPGGYGAEWAGLSYQERLSGSQAPMLYALSVLVVFLSLAALYESWTVPFSVILAVPVGVLGALIAATLFGQSNDVYFKVGLLTTIGLAAKNAILIVEFAKDEEAKGRSTFDATLEAARLRLRPIVMTSLAFILGVLPLAKATGAGSAAQNAIGVGVLGGMLAATLLGIFFVPSFYMIVRRLFGGVKRRSGPAESGAATRA